MLMSMVEVGKTAELFTEAGVRFPMTRFRLVLDAIIWNLELPGGPMGSDDSICEVDEY